MAHANEEYILSDATALYEFHDAFLDGALIFRNKQTQELELFDLNKSIITIIQHGPPNNCSEIIISSNEGTIFGTCVPNTLKETAE